MADSRTPLLEPHRRDIPAPGGGNFDLPIFLQACHSQWSGISQTGLVYTRAAIVGYLTALGGMILNQKLNRDDEDTAWRIPFQFSTVSLAMLWLYHVMTFAWSFTHLYYPDIDEMDRRIEMRALRLFSPPTQKPNSRRRFYFSMFYTATQVNTLTNALMYWAVLVPQHHGHLPSESETRLGGLSTGAWFQPFCVINGTLGTSLVALLEMGVLNSIKPQVPVPSHALGMAFLNAAYLGWASFGKILTGHAPLFWMDPKNVSFKMPDIVAGYCAIFVVSGPALFGVTRGVITAREFMTRPKINQILPESQGHDVFGPGEFIENLGQSIQQDYHRVAGGDHR